MIDYTVPVTRVQHLQAGLDYQNKLARFLENHDEPRAAATFTPGIHQAAAVITYLSPGCRFFHHGRSRPRKRLSPPRSRAPIETPDDALSALYDRLLALLHHPTVRDGNWRTVESTPAWEGNWTSGCFVAWLWTGTAGNSWLVAVQLCCEPKPMLRSPAADVDCHRGRAL